MRTTPFGVLIESLQIDKLRKRWVARCLFLLVYFVNAAVLFFEPGDSDFSAYNAWVEKLQSLNPETTALPPMPLNLMANLLFVFSIIALLFFNMLISYVYTRILIGDYAGQSVGSSLKSYLRRFPYFLVFILVLWIIILFLSSVMNRSQATQWLFIYAIILVITYFFFVPSYLVFEKKGFIEAFTQNASRTRGLKPFIFISILSLHVLYSVPKFFLVMFLWEYREASAILDAFLISFLCLSFARMSAVIYRMVNMQNEKNESSQNSIENS